MFEIIVDDQSLRNLTYITSVNRTMGPKVENRSIKVTGYIINDVLKTVDVLNRLMTGELQRFVFTDQPDRFWMGRLKENIMPSNPEQWAKLDFEIEVPDGVSYAIEPKEITVSNATSVMIENNGTEKIYPQFELMLKGDTHMVSLVNNQSIFQYGESLEASPLKEVSISRTEVTDGHISRRKQDIFIDHFNNANSWKAFNITSMAPKWKSSGFFSAGQGGAKVPTNGKIKIAKHAYYWQTGEKMASHVKGQTYDVVQTKKVNQSHSKKAYLLRRGKTYMGWLLEQDIDSSQTSQSGSIVPNYGSGGAYNWYGPSIQRTFKGKPTNWSFSLKHFFNVSKASEMGAVYMAVRSGDDHVASILFSAHSNDNLVNIYFSVNEEGMNMGKYDKKIVSNFYGRMLIKKTKNKFNFEVTNDKNKKTLQRSYSIPGMEEVEVDNVVIWCGKYGNFTSVKDNRPEFAQFTGEDTKVWIKPKTETVTDVVNLPDPKYTWHADDMIRIDMDDMTAELNGIEELTPIAYGSKALAVPPGEYEIAVVTSGDVPPDLTVRYRECFK